MTRRSRRDFGALTEAQIRAKRIDPRRVDASSLLRTPEPKRMVDLLDAIQQVEEAAKGERSFLHRRG
ncbi:hypothetical protein [Methylobacterium dankookense]|uniref:Uncharacterized protein n=1 Tax=Methylobacterium dankookense TaxID=560405 RepID=A0A564FTG1_9HYPH|nr:hypothetical protein [Methylobacterium dankookense]GJD54880.1 hypothetical protein IFDJLNFL_0759 [Methylobacterium dankookense]VUF11098.1 hypothetical protein MTDSW087_00771 [Methylobacterium dankookense]